MNVENLRTDFPKPNEFNGKFPKHIPVLAITGIMDSNKNPIMDTVSWDVCYFFHVDKQYSVGFEGKANEHGTKYECLAWMPLPLSKKIIKKIYSTGE